MLDILGNNLRSLYYIIKDLNIQCLPIVNFCLKIIPKIMILEWKKHSAKNPRIFFFSILKNLMQRTVQRKELIMVSTEHEVWLEQIDYTIALQQTHMI